MDWNWKGNLRDDCTAVGEGLMLRAEMMDRGHWWWAVFDNEGRRGCSELAVSHDEYPYYARTGKLARAAAEAAAERIMSERGTGNV